jgi:hypothetical protein
MVTELVRPVFFDCEAKHAADVGDCCEWYFGAFWCWGMLPTHGPEIDILLLLG